LTVRTLVLRRRNASSLALIVLPLAFMSSIDTRWQLLFASKGRAVAVAARPRAQRH
jgi:hypothetical protein